PHGDLERTGLVVGLELGRAVEVALGERRVLEQLAVAVAVAIGRLYLARRVEAQPELLLALGQLPRVGGAPRDHQVVALAERDTAEDAAQHSTAAVHVDHLVALAVAIEAVERGHWLAHRD